MRNKFDFVWLLIVCLWSFHFNIQGQDVQDVDNATAAFNFKLDYEVPESPAFSILDANPTTVVRGSAAQELIINFASKAIVGNQVGSGVAMDFNPYFVFGGRLQNIEEYRSNTFKRILANTQLSFGTSAIEELPNDLLMSSGIRITLFDRKDMLLNKKLGDRIDSALFPVMNDSLYKFEDDTIQVVDNKNLVSVYSRTKQEMINMKGGAISIGYATAGRLAGSEFVRDSLFAYRSQIWVSGQYSFRGGLNFLGLLMYRRNKIASNSGLDEFKVGMGIRYVSNIVNLGGEFVYSTIYSRLDVGFNVEVMVLDRILVYTSIGNRTDPINGSNKVRVLPGIKWNLSKV